MGADRDIDAGPPGGRDEHYFTADPSAPFARTPVRIEVWGHRLDLVSGSGVFAHGRLDIGTGVLLRTMDPPTTAGQILDLGCGYGPIGLAIAVAVPGARVTAVDVNARAVALANENARALGVDDRYAAMTPEQVDPALRFDEIWSNPPIRIGKSALHELLLQWLPRLTPHGRAVLVVGRNLGADSLAAWLQRAGHPTRRMGSAKGFRVLQVGPDPRSTQ